MLCSQQSITQALTESAEIPLGTGIFNVENANIDINNSVITIEGNSVLLFSGKVISCTTDGKTTKLSITNFSNIGKLQNGYFYSGKICSPIIVNCDDSVVICGKYQIEDYAEYKIYELSSKVNFSNTSFSYGAVILRNLVIVGKVNFKNVNLSTVNCSTSADNISIKNSKWVSTKMSLSNTKITAKNVKFDWFSVKMRNTSLVATHSKVNIKLLLGYRSELSLAGGCIFLKNSNDITLRLKRLATGDVKKSCIVLAIFEGSRVYNEKSSIITEEKDENSILVSKYEASGLDFLEVSSLSCMM